MQHPESDDNLIEERAPISHVWRAFRMYEDPDRNLLLGPTGFEWETPELHAICSNGVAHTAPNERCGCGIYGWYEPRPVFDQYLSHWLRQPDAPINVLARCLYWGKTIIGTTGVRTQFVRIDKMYVICDSGKIAQQAFNKLPESFENVEMVFIPTDTDDLLTILQG